MTADLPDPERLELEAKLLEAVGQAVIATDAEGRVIYWNRAAEALYGWKAGEVEGRPVMELNVTPESSYEAARILEVLRAGQAWTGEFTVRRKDGSRFEAFVQNSPILDDEGRVTGIIGISADVTRQRALEEQLLRSQKLEAVGRLAGGVAHDFNNLLTVIQGHSRLLLEDLPEQSSLRGDVEQILNAAGRAAGLTRHLLAFSRRQLLEEKVVDLAEVVMEMEPMLRRLIPSEVELRFEGEEKVALVRADPGQLHQVLFNLAVNARDAIEDRGRITFRVGVASLSEDDVAELPWHARPGRYASVEVLDDGTGMSAQVLSRIFEPFFTTKPEGEGSGLGLSMVFGTVKQSGGHVIARSEPGKGTTMQVLLPLVEGEVTPPSGGSAAVEAEQGRGEAVLVVDDDPALREVAARILDRAGFIVHTAANGRDALLLLETEGSGIRLVLSDIVMPEMGGLLFVDELGRRRLEVPVVLMSGYSEEELAEGARHQAAGFLEKPFSPERLIHAVREALAK